MDYKSISNEAERLSYRDKLRLAQLLIQLARKEEEEQNPEERASSPSSTPSDPELIEYVVERLRKLASSPSSTPSDPELIEYVAERLRKLRPSKRGALLNSIKAMFQFQGGVSEADKEKIVFELVEKGHIRISENDRVEYL